jgi:hypothetical protein
MGKDWLQSILAWVLQNFFFSLIAAALIYFFVGLLFNVKGYQNFPEVWKGSFIGLCIIDILLNIVKGLAQE